MISEKGLERYRELKEFKKTCGLSKKEQQELKKYTKILEVK